MTLSLKTGLLATAAIITLGAGGAMAQGLNVGVGAATTAASPDVSTNTSINAGARTNAGAATNTRAGSSANMDARTTGANVGVGANADAGVNASTRSGTSNNRSYTGAETSADTNTAGTVDLSASHIEDAQEALNNRGFNVAADGAMGAQTRAAVRSFQSANNLPATGNLDAQTMAALNVETNTGARW